MKPTDTGEKEKKRVKKKTAKDARKERVLGRERKAKELSDEHDLRVTSIKSYEKRPASDLSDEERQIVSWFHTHDYEELIPKKKFVADGIKTWEAEQEVFVSGVYRDDDWVRANVQRQFISDLRACRPTVFTELHTLVPAFLKAFGEVPLSFEKVFNTFETQRLFGYIVEAKSSVESHIGAIEMDLNQGRSCIQADWRRLADYKEGFRWHDLRLLLEVIDARVSVSRGIDPSQRLTSIGQMISHALSFPDFGVMASTSSTSPEARRVFAAFGRTIAKRWAYYDEPVFIATARRVLQRLLEVETPDKVDALVKFLLRIDDWATKHFLEKDWILRFACYLLDQHIHESLDLMTCDLPIHLDWSLYTEPFKFEFNPWFPGTESKEAYEKRLKKDFDRALYDFFQENGRRLNLDRATDKSVKAVTRPIQVENIGCLIAWNEGATAGQIAEGFSRDEANSIDKAIAKMKTFGLPAREGPSGEKGSVSLQRIRDIRNAIAKKNLSRNNQ